MHGNRSQNRPGEYVQWQLLVSIEEKRYQMQSKVNGDDLLGGTSAALVHI